MTQADQLRAALVRATAEGNALALLDIRARLDALTAANRERRI